MKISLIRFLFSLLTVTALGLPSAFAQTTERVSVDSAGVQGNEISYWPSISANGHYAAFESRASNLVLGDTNQASDIFVRDLQTGLTTRVSVDSSGVQGNSGSSWAAISGDGRFVAFSSYASNLVANDTNNASDVFLHDRLTGQTTRVSVDSFGAQANGYSLYLAISSDGTTVVFTSFASNLVQGDTNNNSDVFLHDLLTGSTICVSVDSSGEEAGALYHPSVSSDGRFTGFESASTNIVPNDTNGKHDSFVHDRLTGQTSRVSLDSGGMEGNDDSAQSAISADGRYVAFFSIATNLVPGDTNAIGDVFVHDRRTGQTSRVSVDSAGVQGNKYSSDPSISADGRYVAFYSDANNFVPLDANSLADTFVHDIQTGDTSRVSVDSSGVEGNYGGSPGRNSISGDGLFVAIQSASTNLVPGDTNGFMDVFIHKIGPITFSLAKSGACPGALSLMVTRSTPNRNVAFVYGPSGNFVKPTPPCQGLILGLAQPKLGAYVVADAAGTAVLNFYAPPAVCGLTVQAVDMPNCAATNTIVL